jgi:hypothetical protein
MSSTLSSNPRSLDAHSIILNVIEIHIMYPNIINVVCKTLTELVEDDEIRDMMIEEGICEKILNVFRIYQNNRDIMSSCSYIIFNLTKNIIAAEYIRNNLMDDEMEILSNLMDYFLGNEDQNQEQYDDIPALERIGDDADDAPSYPHEDEYLHINRDELIIVFD